MKTNAIRAAIAFLLVNAAVTICAAQQPPDETLLELQSRGIESYKAQQFDKAIDAFSRALALKPDDAPTNNNLGVTLAALGRDRQAIEFLERAVKLEPEFAEALEMLLPSNPSGFNATLSSYRGLVESDFELSTKQSASDAAHNRRRVGVYGNGKAQITLDSFEGFVRLTRLATIPACK